MKQIMNQTKNTITILLADDHWVVRQGFWALLAGEKDLQVIGEAETGRLAVERTVELQPDVVVMDIAMPLLNGMDAARKIQAAAPKTKVLILSAYSSDDYVDRVANCGASGYLLKQSSAALLTQAIRSLADGRTFFDPAVSKRRRQTTTQVGQADRSELKPMKPLSARESEVLRLIAEGEANKQIASVLDLSIKTVEKHRQRLMNKLQIHNTAGLTRYAFGNQVSGDNVQVAVI